jgi:hypothetical protein
LKSDALPAKFDPMSFTGSGFGFGDEDAVFSAPASPSSRFSPTPLAYSPASPAYSPTSPRFSFNPQSDADALISQMWGGGSAKANANTKRVVKINQYDPEQPVRAITVNFCS